MASCEKCWGDAYTRLIANPTKSKAEHYSDLVAERKAKPCLPEEQAGINASVCPKCKRKTIHQYARICMNCK